MRILWIIWMFLLTLPQEPQTSDEVMTRMKEALGRASSVSVEFSIEYVESEGREGPQKKTFKGHGRFTADGKAHCKMVDPNEGNPKDHLIIEVISTGSRIGTRRGLDQPFEIHEVPIQPFPDLADAIFYLGSWELPSALSQAAKRAVGGKEKAELLGALRQRIDVSKSERVDVEKVDGREGAVVGCSMTPKGQDKPIGTIRMWIDKSTWLPFRREQRFETPSRKGTIVETFAEVNLNAKLDPKRFELPEEKK